MAETFSYDVILCHAPKDRAAARLIANGLRREGFQVWFEGWRLGSDENIETAMINGLYQSRVLLLLFSANACHPASWSPLESRTFSFRDPANPGKRFVPILLDDTSLPESLRPFAYVDWRLKPDKRWATLLLACAQPQRTQPATNAQLPKYQFPRQGGPVLTVSLSSTGANGYSATADGKIHVWDLRAGQRSSTLEGHRQLTGPIALTPAGDWVFQAGPNIEFWSAMSGCRTKTIATEGRELSNISISGDGGRFIFGFRDGGLSTMRDSDRASVPPPFLTPLLPALSALSRNGVRIAVLSAESLRVFDAVSAEVLLNTPVQVTKPTSIAIDDHGATVLVGSVGGVIQIIDPRAGRCIGYLEGHKSTISAVEFVSDSHTAISASDDGSLRLWNLDNGVCLLELTASQGPLLCVAATAGAEVVVAASKTGALCVWSVDLLKTRGSVDINAALRYTNAKVLLVGESGVGKSALAHRLVQNAFVATCSTDGTWATQMKLPHSNTTAALEREIWLWDFAGQADYRLIHQLFFDETALAVLVFNPQAEDPFDALGQWDNDLLRAARRPYRKLLVAGRLDRGRLIPSKKDIDAFINERCFSKYIETSAVTGLGCDDLREAIVSTIPWDDVPWTASPRVFKLLKDAVVSLKDEAQKGKFPVVLRTIELKQRLEFRLSEKFTLEELQAVIGLLAGPGIIWHLAFGDFVLLQPEKINAYAAAVVRSIRSHPDEIGVIEEDMVLSGALDYADLKRLPDVEELIVLRAMHQTFVDRGLCIRQHTSQGTLLLFPPYFRRQRPDLHSHPAPLVTYRFAGQLDEIYATLVVRLSHTSAFEKDQLWRYAADFLTADKRRAGFKMTKLGEGRGEITIYCDPVVPDDTKVTFIRYIHDHLMTKDASLERERHYTCLKCHAPVENALAVKRRMARGEHDIACSDCEARVPLVDLIEQRFASDEILGRSRQLEAVAATAIDNESRELILVGHAYAIAGEAGQIFRATPNSDWGIDGEIEFKDHAGRASGSRLYLQLKSGDSYLVDRQLDGAEVFRVKNTRHLEYWRSQAYPVMLVVRTSDARIRWMNVTEYLFKHPFDSQIIFAGEPFTAASLRQMRGRILEQAIVGNRSRARKGR
jgi:WD40 repeat protein/DNA-directed RNA polymerase subunit RPC12/RpoP